MTDLDQRFANFELVDKPSANYFRLCAIQKQTEKLMAEIKAKKI